MKKATLESSIKELPSEFELEDLIEHFIVLDKIDKGQKDIVAKNTFTNQEAEKSLKKWLQ